MRQLAHRADPALGVRDGDPDGLAGDQAGELLEDGRLRQQVTRDGLGGKEGTQRRLFGVREPQVRHVPASFMPSFPR